MQYDWLGSWLRDDDRRDARAWVAGLPDGDLSSACNGDWQLGEWVRSSVHIHFRVNQLNFRDDAVCTAFRRYLYSGYLAAAALERLFDDLRPDIQLLFNGRMSSTRVALEIGKRKGVRTICEERGFVRDQVRLIEGTHCVDFVPMTNLWQAWKDIPLSEEEVSAIDGLLLDRKIGKSLPIKPFSPPKSAQRLQDLGKHSDRSKALFVLFTSSLDETAAHDNPSCYFRSQEDWTDQIVHFFARHPELELAIRVHPNAGSTNSFGTNLEDQRYFRRLEIEVPDNVKVIPSDAKVSSYDLMERADVGLVWHSTAAVEMAAMGKRVFRVADAWMKDLDCIEKLGKDFADRLEQAVLPGSNFDPLRVAIEARRWAYMWYFRSSYPLPLVKQLEWNRTKLLYESSNDLRPGASKELDEIVSIFTEGRSADRYPTPSETRRLAETEESLTARLLGLSNPDRAREQASSA